MSAKPEVTHQWMGRPIASMDDEKDLERAAAVNEFSGKLPRDQAEEKAYADHVHTQHVKAAGHHLAGQRAAKGVGDMAAARKHGLLYEMHVEKLGHDKYGPVPPEVKAIHDSLVSGGQAYTFRPHGGDSFLLEGDKKLDGPK
jgi:hypothetical protein